MNKYRNLHLWMLLPMAVMQFGIFKDYWGDFRENAWSVHIHYWTGTVWYLYLIIQPYFATHGQMSRHRTNGIIGMFIAGAVCITALSMMHRDMVSAERAVIEPQNFGPFQTWFFYAIAIVEIVMMTAFGFAVIKSIIHRKQLENHAWWLVSTVFIIMNPSLGRGLGNIWLDMNRKDWPNINIMIPLYLTNVLIILMLLLCARKYGKLKHPATWLAVGVNIFNCFLEPIGHSEAVQDLLKSMIKG